MEDGDLYEVEAKPTLSVVREGAEMANSFKPDVIVALGGGSPMDAADHAGHVPAPGHRVRRPGHALEWTSASVSTSSRKWA
ncbi:iron-containing alcohol dehydrogenase [Shigella flexneri]